VASLLPHLENRATSGLRTPRTRALLLACSVNAAPTKQSVAKVDTEKVELSRLPRVGWRAITIHVLCCAAPGTQGLGGGHAEALTFGRRPPRRRPLRPRHRTHVAPAVFDTSLRVKAHNDESDHQLLPVKTRTPTRTIATPPRRKGNISQLSPS
jgi:hypothetical protein